MASMGLGGLPRGRAGAELAELRPSEILAPHVVSEEDAAALHFLSRVAVFYLPPSLVAKFTYSSEMNCVAALACFCTNRLRLADVSLIPGS